MSEKKKNARPKFDYQSQPRVVPNLIYSDENNTQPFQY